MSRTPREGCDAYVSVAKSAGCMRTVSAYAYVIVDVPEHFLRSNDQVCHLPYRLRGSLSIEITGAICYSRPTVSKSMDVNLNSLRKNGGSRMPLRPCDEDMVVRRSGPNSAPGFVYAPVLVFKASIPKVRRFECSNPTWQQRISALWGRLDSSPYFDVSRKDHVQVQGYECSSVGRQLSPRCLITPHYSGSLAPVVKARMLRNRLVTTGAAVRLVLRCLRLLHLTM